MIRWRPHSIKQQMAVTSEHKITVLGTGIQFGKTTAGAWWLRRKLHQYNSPTDNFLVLSPTYKILSQSTLPPLLKVLEGWGDYNISRSEFKMYNGGTIYFRTNTEPDSIVGITNVRAIWGDEAGKFTLYFWENIQGRSSFKQAQIMLTTSPYTLNWVYKDLIKPSKKGVRSDVLVIQASSNENPYFPEAEYHTKQQTMDPRRFKMMYGGEWDRMTGLVYDCFDEEANIIQPFVLPVGTKFVGGIDWGYTDPFVLLVMGITQDGRYYIVSEFYKTQTTVTDQIQIAKRMMQIWGIEQFFADPSQPGSIDEFNRAGLPTVPADNDIRRGIDQTYELVRTRRLKLFAGRTDHLIDEIDQYHYPEPKDLKPDQDHKEALPVDQSNHALDSLRYLVTSHYGLEKKNKPVYKDHVKKPLHELTQVERYKQLTIGKKNKTYEEW